METMKGMERSIRHVGLDVHQESIDVAVADGSAGAERAWSEVRHVGQIGGDLAALDKTLRRLMSQGHRLHMVYEAGPCGFVICRHLRLQGAGLRGGGALDDSAQTGRSGEDPCRVRNPCG